MNQPEHTPEQIDELIKLGLTARSNLNGYLLDREIVDELKEIAARLVAAGERMHVLLAAAIPYQDGP